MKSIPFDHGDKAYSLRFDINAMARAASLLGEDTAATLLEFEKNRLDIMRTRAVLAASLNVRLTLDQVGDMIQDMGVDVASSLVSRAIMDALPLVLSDSTSAEKDGADAGNGKKD